MKKLLLFTTVFAFIAAYVLAQERIAVFPFEDKENVLTRNEAAMLYRSFYTEFTNRSAERFSLVPQQEIERLISIEAAFIMDNFYTREKIAEIMQTQNAALILSGVIGRSRNNIRISVSIYSYTKDYYPGIDQLPGRSILNAANTEELFNKIPELAQNMYNEISGAIVEPVPVGLEYEIVDRRTVTITEYSGDAVILIIPNYINGLPVTSIRDEAFRPYENLKSVTIPYSVTVIEWGAFNGCSNLTSVTLSRSTQVEGNAFPRNAQITYRD
jgi:TolB-like protein